MSAAPPPQPATGPETVIRVDVRQVLVPVVVLDKSGHSISGLTQSDFQVFEDGVEQTVTSFHVETSGDAAVAIEAKPADPKAASPPPIRHSYLIVIDVLHAEFANLHAVRESLQKFFTSEPPGDSQYGVIALGQSMSILQNMTRDPSAALAALDDKAFIKMFAGSRSSVRDLQDFIQRLERTRAMLDSPDPGTRAMGGALMRRTPPDAEQIAGMDRINTTALLSGRRDLVRQMTAGSGHRTLLLISDGFQLSPGRDDWELLDAYCPGMAGMRGLDRMQSEFESVVKIAARSNVVINTIDSRGLFAPSFTDAPTARPGSAADRVIPAMNRLQSEAGVVLAEFAAATGGTALQKDRKSVV